MQLVRFCKPIFTTSPRLISAGTTTLLNEKYSYQDKCHDTIINLTYQCLLFFSSLYLCFAPQASAAPNHPGPALPSLGSLSLAFVSLTRARSTAPPSLAPPSACMSAPSHAAAAAPAAARQLPALTTNSASASDAITTTSTQGYTYASAATAAAAAIASSPLSAAASDDSLPTETFTPSASGCSNTNDNDDNAGNSGTATATAAPFADVVARLRKSAAKAFRAGQFANAAVHCSEAIALDPANHTHYSNRSAAFAALQNYPRALKDALKCVALCPAFGKGYFRAGYALESMLRYREALTYYDQVRLPRLVNTKRLSETTDFSSMRRYLLTVFS
mgnify:CR=1 FL=1